MTETENWKFASHYKVVENKVFQNHVYNNTNSRHAHQPSAKYNLFLNFSIKFNIKFLEHSDLTLNLECITESNLICLSCLSLKVKSPKLTLYKLNNILFQNSNYQSEDTTQKKILCKIPQIIKLSSLTSQKVHKFLLFY